ncbi:class I SAM-dependent methyltransferase [Rubrimonas cliftonensis]|nr:class I SAM-dependent methyltransferase [Rubrimonas cliftonensis]
MTHDIMDKTSVIGAISVCVLERRSRILRVHGWLTAPFESAVCQLGAFGSQTVHRNVPRRDVVERFGMSSDARPGWRVEVRLPELPDPAARFRITFLLAGKVVAMLERTVTVDNDGVPEFHEALFAQFHALNAEIAASRAPVEGGMFFLSTDAFGADVAPTTVYAAKRAHFRDAVRGRLQGIEIGFNGGHSALMALSLNPELRLTAVDIGHHPYTALAARFLKRLFPERFRFVEGDSREVVPALRLALVGARFDFAHIDGGHTPEICRADISNALTMTAPGGVVVVDDLGDPALLAVTAEFEAAGLLERVPGFEEILEARHGVFVARPVGLDADRSLGAGEFVNVAVAPVSAADDAQADAGGETPLVLLRRLCGAEPERRRLTFDLFRALSRSKEFELLSALGENVLPFKVGAADAQRYGLAFEAWCEAVYSAAPRRTATEAVAAMCFADAALNGERPWNTLYLGATVFGTAGLVPAEAYFLRVAAMDETMISTNAHGASSLRLMLPPAPAAPSPFDDLDNVAFAAADLADGPFVHLVACDWRYWELFSNELLGSAAQVRSSAVLHVHILNPEQPLEALRSKARADYPELALNLSGHSVRLPEALAAQWDGMNARALYTCMRFLIAPHVLKRYGRSVLITEFDANLNSSIAQVDMLNQDADVFLCHYRENQQNHFPWNQIWAGTLLLKHTPGAIRYAEMVAQYCKHVFAAGTAENRPMWHIDQNALFVAAEQARTADPSIRFAQFADAARPISRNFGNVFAVRGA